MDDAMASLLKVQDILVSRPILTWDQQMVAKVCKFLQSACVQQGRRLMEAFRLLWHLSLNPAKECESIVRSVLMLVVMHPSFAQLELCLLGELILEIADMPHPITGVSLELPIGRFACTPATHVIPLSSAADFSRLLAMYCQVLAASLQLAAGGAAAWEFAANFVAMSSSTFYRVGFAGCVEGIAHLAATLCARHSSSLQRWMPAVLTSIVRWLQAGDISSRLNDDAAICSLLYAVLRAGPPAVPSLLLLRADLIQVMGKMEEMHSSHADQFGEIVALLHAVLTVSTGTLSASLPLLLSCCCRQRSSAATCVVIRSVLDWLRRVDDGRCVAQLRQLVVQQCRESRSSGQRQPAVVGSQERAAAFGIRYDEHMQSVPGESILMLTSLHADSPADGINGEAMNALVTMFTTMIGRFRPHGLSPPRTGSLLYAEAEGLSLAACEAFLVVGLLNELAVGAVGEDLACLQEIETMTVRGLLSVSGADQQWSWLLIDLVHRRLANGNLSLQSLDAVIPALIAGMSETIGSVHHLNLHMPIQGDRSPLSLCLVEDNAQQVVGLRSAFPLTLAWIDVAAAISGLLVPCEGSQDAVQMFKVELAKYSDIAAAVFLRSLMIMQSRVFGDTSQLVAMAGDVAEHTKGTASLNNSAFFHRLLWEHWRDVVSIIQRNVLSVAHQPDIWSKLFQRCLQPLGDACEASLLQYLPKEAATKHVAESEESSPSQHSETPNASHTHDVDVAASAPVNSVMGVLEQLHQVCWAGQATSVEMRRDVQDELHHLEEVLFAAMDRAHWPKCNDSYSNPSLVAMSSTLSSFMRCWCVSALDELHKKIAKVNDSSAAFKAINEHAGVKKLQEFIGSHASNKLLVLILVKACSLLAQCTVEVSPIIAVWALSQLIDMWSEFSVQHAASECRLLSVLIRDELHFVFEKGFVSVLTRFPELIILHIVFPVVQNCCARGDGGGKSSADLAILQAIVDKLLKVKSSDGVFCSFKPWLSSSSVGCLLLATLVMRLDSQHFVPAGQLMQCLGLLESKAGLQLPKSYLLDEMPLFLYHILMSTEMVIESYAVVVQGLLHKKLQQLAVLLGVRISVCAAGQDAALTRNTFNQVLLPLIWSMGSDNEQVSRRAQKGLNIVCIHQSCGSWTVDKLDKRKLTEKAIIPHTQSLLSELFLYVMSNLLQHEWSQQSYSQQSQCLRALHCLVQILKPQDTIKFLPKILTAVDSALAQRTKRMVQLLAVRIAVTLSAILPAEILADHICSLLVSTYPIMQHLKVEKTKSEARGDAAKNALHNPARFETSLPALVYSVAGQSSNPSLLLASAEESLAEEAKALATQMMVDTLSSDSELVKRLPYIPDLPDLKDIRDIYDEFRRGLSLGDRLKALVALFKHSSEQVVLAALRACAQELKDCKSNLYDGLSRALLDNNLAVNNTNRDVTLGLVNVLVDELLSLSVRQHDQEVLLECSICLGELGALNPSYITYNLAGGAEASNRSSCHVFYPLEINCMAFGMHLLCKYIVPGLKSAQGSSSQDKSAFAIQKIVHILADSFKESEDAISPTAGMPAMLKQAMVEKGIFDTVEPFWFSKYSIKDAPAEGAVGHNLNLTSAPLTAASSHPALPNIVKTFSSNTSFTRWIGEWCRHLILVNTGPLQSIYYACRGVVRNNSGLCQFLLPYLLLDALRCQERHAQACIEELSSVLEQHSQRSKKGVGVDEKTRTDQRAVQYIFSILDMFSIWMQHYQQTALQQRKSKRSSQGSNSSSTSKSVMSSDSLDNTNTVSSDACDDIVQQLRGIINAFPSGILCQAAVSIKAYARAIRYIEIRARQQQVQQGAVPRVSSSDRMAPPRKDYHIYTDLIPALSSLDLDGLCFSYAMLEDVDALQGVQAVRKAQCVPDLHNKCSVLEFELKNDWMNALLEYDLLYSSGDYQRARERCAINSDALSAARVRSTGRKSGGLPSMKASSKRARLSLNQPIAQPEDSEDECYADWADMCDVEKGKLRCLLELEHLESVVNHVMIRKESGMSVPQLQNAILPLGIEAAWRLADWGALDGLIVQAERSHIISSAQHSGGSGSVAVLEGDDAFRVSLGRLMAAAHNRNQDLFDGLIAEVRTQTMNSLSAASMESYGRSYPYLVRLQCLSDVERVCGCVDRVPASALDETMETTLQLPQRLQHMSDSITHRSHIMAVHRTLFSLLSSSRCEQRSSNIGARCKLLSGKNWLQLGSFLSELGRHNSAFIALKFADQCGIDKETIILRQGQLLKEQGQVQDALTLMEPVELDIAAIAEHLKVFSDSAAINKGNSNTALPAYIDSIDKRIILAQRIHLTTQCLQESQQRQGVAIIERYRTIIALHQHWDKPYYDFAKYYEYLYHQYYSGTKTPTGAGGVTSGINLASQLSGGSTSSDQEGSGEYQLIGKALEKYGQCLVVSTNSMMIAEVLPRMLTLWLAFTAMGNGPAAGRGARRGSGDSASSLQVIQTAVNESMDGLVKRIPAHVWFIGIAQLVSRVLHNNPATVAVLINIILQIMCEYPKNAIWHIANLMYSFNSDRKAVAKRLLRDTYKQLSASRKGDAQMLADSQMLFQSLITLAAFQTKDKKMRWQIDKKVVLANFLAPTQEALLSCRHGQMFIAEFQDQVEVASSKAKPKTIVLLSQCGRRIKFLCKQEKDGDLRKDAHMMEVNTLVNRLLQGHIGGRQRKLGVTTYGVICLNEECGLLEWVNHTECLRAVINSSYSYDPSYVNLSFREVYQPYMDFQAKHEHNLPQLVAAYNQLIGAHGYRPAFHKWFLHKHPDPTAWLAAREKYTHSVAVWSAVGYVIGLGDRHTENILINTATCEAVHVDFDCLFDKGLLLLRPEIVPFRLTANMIDAMGVTGIEGAYRHTLELCLSVLREHREALLSVLEPFLRDPTVNWSRAGRAQRSSTDSGTATAAAQGGTDSENKEANDMLGKISERLKGVYNIVHPHREKLLRVSSLSVDGSVLGRGLGAGKEEQLLPLSVQGQAQRLIDEATAVENLAQLYVGWQPWM